MSGCPGSPSQGYANFLKTVSLAISKHNNYSLTAKDARAVL